MVACVHVEQDAEACWIGMLATLPGLQAGGIGKRMLAAAEAHGRTVFGTRRFRMNMLSDRPELLAFYQRRGYRLTGEVQPYPSGDGIGRPLQAQLQVLGLEKPA